MNHSRTPLFICAFATYFGYSYLTTVQTATFNLLAICLSSFYGATTLVILFSLFLRNNAPKFDAIGIVPICVQVGFIIGFIVVFVAFINMCIDSSADYDVGFIRIIIMFILVWPIGYMGGYLGLALGGVFGIVIGFVVSVISGVGLVIGVIIGSISTAIVFLTLNHVELINKILVYSVLIITIPIGVIISIFIIGKFMGYFKNEQSQQKHLTLETDHHIDKPKQNDESIK